MKDNFFINSIFPTPVYSTDLNYNFSKNEINFLKKSERESNSFNTRTKNSYVLNNNLFKKLKLGIEQHIKNYSKNVLCNDDCVSLYITQSWFNFTKVNEGHHKHAHPNSFVSGVYYVNADINHDKIFFLKGKHSFYRLKTKEWNLWNSEEWFFPVKTGQLILFPSDLQHYVQTKNDNNERISLAFNVFLKGNLGNEETLTELIL